MAINEREGANEFVPGDGFVVGVGDGEMRAGDKAGAKGEEKEQTSEQQGSCRRPAGDADRVGMPGSVGAPVWRRGGGGCGA